MADELYTIVTLHKEIRALQEQVQQLKRHHLQFVTMLTYSFGGEMRVTPYDYASVPLGATLTVWTDPMTHDTVFKVEVPAHDRAGSEGGPGPHEL